MEKVFDHQSSDLHQSPAKHSRVTFSQTIVIHEDRRSYQIVDEVVYCQFIVYSKWFSDQHLVLWATTSDIRKWCRKQEMACRSLYCDLHKLRPSIVKSFSHRSMPFL